MEMRPSGRRLAYTVIILLTRLCQPGLAAAQASSAYPAEVKAPWANPFTEAQIRDKATTLLRQMTPDEKIAQLSQLPGTDSDEFKENVKQPMEEILKQVGAGSILWISDPKEINRLQHVAVEQSRLHIPVLFGLDVIHGYHTIFPAPIAMASSWDTKMVEDAQSVAAQEARAVGIQWTFAPMVDIARDARWGRMVEGSGEDPYLGAAMARAQVLGFQGKQLGAPDQVLACAKHFAGYGAVDGGRDYDSSYIPEEQMWNTYLPPFKAAIDAGAGSLMSAYMDLNDVPASGNRWLLHDVLRDSWGFQGFVVSDAFAVRSLRIHGYASDPQDAAHKAFTAGLNMDMASGTYLKYLPMELQQGRISMQQIDDAVLPILEIKFRMGLFEHPYIDESRIESTLNDPAHQQMARRAVQRSVVLLRNEGGLLPLDKSGKTIHSIAVIGPLADAHNDLLSMWGALVKPGPTVSILQGIREKAGSAIHVVFAHGPNLRRIMPSPLEGIAMTAALQEEPPQTEQEAKQPIEETIALARQSDVAVLVVGEIDLMSGEYASRSSLRLSNGQEELLEAVSATGKPVVLVLVNGRPLDISWAAEHVPAILEAWYPGSQGGNGIADVLFGDANPSGHLPVSWPRSSGQLPLYYNHNLTQNPETEPDFKSRYWDLPSTPLYPFGYGLGYATFSFDNLKVTSTARAGNTIDVSADVTNTGNRAGDAVVQLYIHQRAGSASRPVRQLKGFQRVALEPGSKSAVHFTLGQDELQFWSPTERKWVVEPEQFDVWVGEDSSASLHGDFRLTK
ncbi:MAG TPA: beta-glucosidase BglX [Candidatus Eremiobacteraceae bacterium]|nr:beta-glucosidase BglX [Candidatus Eremiobacteraceae bacterium]